MTLGEGVFGEEVGVDGVFDVDHVDLILCVADDAEPPRARPGEHAGHQMRIAHPPNEMRPQGDSAQRLAMGCEHLTFGQRFGEWIRTRAHRGERKGFIGT